MSKEKEQGAEEKIIEAAKKVFYEKGFFGARMQEIADKAEINKAMLHYYFRSKQKLFDMIFTKALKELFQRFQIIDSEKLTLEEQIDIFSKNYMDFLGENPYLPTFIIYEINFNADKLKEIILEIKANLPKNMILNIQKGIQEGDILPVNPMHIIINLLSLCVFPFIAKPLLTANFEISDEQFEEILNERKNLVKVFILDGIRKK